MRQRLSIFTLSFAAMATFATPVLAHPGHDAHAPQHGLLHWLLSPIHSTVVGLVVSLIVVTGLTLFAAMRRQHWIVAKNTDGTAEA